MAAPYPNTTYLTTSPSPQPESGGSTKPTILAFHGSGSNSTIHTVQLARVSRYLKDNFDIISLEAPFPSAAGPGILPFFEGCGPFKRWLPPHEKVTVEGMKHGDASDIMPLEVETLVRDTVLDVKSKGGKVVGAIGFSQGTRVVAGLLKGSEIRKKLGSEGDGLEWLDFTFGLSICGSYPPPIIPPSVDSLLQRKLGAEEAKELRKSKIQSPTLHIQGKQDEWEWAGRLLIDEWYEEADGKSLVLAFDMAHHYPSLHEESEKIGAWAAATWRKIEAEERRR